MSWVTTLWAMMASACLTLALVHLLVWWRRREAQANLLFALTATATAMFAGCELWMMRAETPAAFGAAVRWAHVPAWVLILSLVGFVRLYLRAGRIWLAWTVCGVRTLSLILNFVFAPNLNYRVINAVRHISFLGEMITAPLGIPRPWMLVSQLGLLLLVIFVADASITVWRRGDRRQALLVGGSSVFFVVAGTFQLILTLWGIIHAPITVSLFFMGIVAAMGYELSQDVLRAARLSDDLRESQQQMALATDAVNLGIWIQDLVRNEIWATDKWRELLGFEKSERIELNGFLQKLHPDDREAVGRIFAKAMSGEGGYEMEYRVEPPDGRTRWIASRGRVEFNSAGKPVLIRGASLDITTRKQVEEELFRGRKLESLGVLAGGIAHDFNNFLTIIAGNIALAKMHLPPADPVCDILEQAAVATKRATSLALQLLTFGKGGAPVRRPCRLDGVVKDAVELARAGAIATIELAIAGDLWSADQTGSGRILVMDEEEALRMLLAQILKRLGYEVESARDGAEAINLYQKAKDSGRRFDIVLVDLTIPGGIGGKEVAARLREVDDSVILIVSSGYSNTPNMSEFRKYGFNDVLSKPWSPLHLSEVLGRYTRTPGTPKTPRGT
jgi:two-component system sensor kinase FixL